MPKTVQIYGVARNAKKGPQEVAPGIEVWAANGPYASVHLRCPHVLNIWTRWFNLHSKAHMVGTYPKSYHYYQTQAAGRPIYFQKSDPDVPTSKTFPRKEIQEFFRTAKGPNRYFTCSVCWMIAFAIFEGFERIELWGFELRDTKPGSAYAWERPCVAYWIKQARDRGIEVFYQEAIEKLYADGKMVPGDPDEYTGKLYGYSTKPEPDWDPVLEDFRHD